MKYTPKKERGSVIIYAVSILSILVAITISITYIFIPKLKTASAAVNSINALYAADSGIEWCLYVNRLKPSPPSKPTFLSGAVAEIYSNRGREGVSDCQEPFLDHRSVGTYKNVARSFSVN